MVGAGEGDVGQATEAAGDQSIGGLGGTQLQPQQVQGQQILSGDISQGLPLVEALQQLSGGRQQHLVGIEHQHPIAGGVAQGGIAGSGEVVDPVNMAHLGPVGLGDRHRVIPRPGIDHDDFTHHPLHAI